MLLGMVLWFLSVNSNAMDMYPAIPRDITTGSLCTKPIETRYPEGIAYCGRIVSDGMKKHIIKLYDEKYGYSIEKMNRQDFTIDHYVSLCMGGSNSAENLWPQHYTSKHITDPLEVLLCRKMVQGLIKQSEAVMLIKRAKNNLHLTPEIIEYVNSL